MCMKLFYLFLLLSTCFGWSMPVRNVQQPNLVNVSAASYGNAALAPESIVAAFGTGLATATQAAANLPLPTTLAGTTVRIRDSASNEYLAPLFYVSPRQVNYLMPAGMATGTATIIVTSSNGSVSSGIAQIAAVAPGLFTADGSGRGLAAAMALRIRADGSQSYEPIAQFVPAQNQFVAEPIEMGPASDRVYLVLYGTGFRLRRALNAVTARVGAVETDVFFAGALEGFAGLDQINILLPRAIIGRGQVSVTLRVEGMAANSVQAVVRPQWTTPVVNAPRVQYHTFYSETVKSRVSYHIYTPEQYDLQRERRFPVLYWLHGTGGGLPGIGPLRAFFDNAIRTGKMPPVLVVFPNSFPTGMWCDAKDGSLPVETVTVRELLPQIDGNFRTIATPAGRLVEGFSMGGYGAGRWGFKFADIFGAFSMLAGGPLDLDFSGPRAMADPELRNMILLNAYGGDLAYFQVQSPWRLAEKYVAEGHRTTRLRVVIGDNDDTFSQSRDFTAHLTQLGIAHEYIVVPGVGHDTLSLLSGLGERNWEFYRAVFAASSMDGEK